MGFFLRVLWGKWFILLNRGIGKIKVGLKN